MNKNDWSDRFSLIAPWFADIIQVIKRDCKSEHLRLDPYFVRKHFGGKPVQYINLEDMRDVYLQQILAGNDTLAEFVSNRWVFRHMDVYRFFEKELTKICPKFEQLHNMSEEQAATLINEASQEFGVEKVFCFVVLNEVTLPDQIFERLQQEALDKLAVRQKDEETKAEMGALQKLQQELDRTKERYEKKIQEMTKRHQKEIELLRKQLETSHV